MFHDALAKHVRTDENEQNTLSLPMATLRGAEAKQLSLSHRKDALLKLEGKAVNATITDQLTAGSSTYRIRRLHLVTGCLPSLVHAPGTNYLIPSETRLCYS